MLFKSILSLILILSASLQTIAENEAEQKGGSKLGEYLFKAPQKLFGRIDDSLSNGLSNSGNLLKNELAPSEDSSYLKNVPILGSRILEDPNDGSKKIYSVHTNYDSFPIEQDSASNQANANEQSDQEQSYRQDKDCLAPSCGSKVVYENVNPNYPVKQTNYRIDDDSTILPTSALSSSFNNQLSGRAALAGGSYEVYKGARVNGDFGNAAGYSYAPSSVQSQFFPSGYQVSSLSDSFKSFGSVNPPAGFSGVQPQLQLYQQNNPFSEVYQRKGVTGGGLFILPNVQSKPAYPFAERLPYNSDLYQGSYLVNSPQVLGKNRLQSLYIPSPVVKNSESSLGSYNVDSQSDPSTLYQYEGVNINSKVKPVLPPYPFFDKPYSSFGVNAPVLPPSISSSSSQLQYLENFPPGTLTYNGPLVGPGLNPPSTQLQYLETPAPPTFTINGSPLPSGLSAGNSQFQFLENPASPSLSGNGSPLPSSLSASSSQVQFLENAPPATISINGSPLPSSLSSVSGGLNYNGPIAGSGLSPSGTQLQYLETPAPSTFSINGLPLPSSLSSGNSQFQFLQNPASPGLSGNGSPHPSSLSASSSQLQFLENAPPATISINGSPLPSSLSSLSGSLNYNGPIAGSGLNPSGTQLQYLETPAPPTFSINGSPLPAGLSSASSQFQFLENPSGSFGINGAAFPSGLNPLSAKYQFFENQAVNGFGVNRFSQKPLNPYAYSQVNIGSPVTLPFGYTETSTLVGPKASDQQVEHQTPVILADYQTQPNAQFGSSQQHQIYV